MGQRWIAIACGKVVEFEFKIGGAGFADAGLIWEVFGVFSVIQKFLILFKNSEFWGGRLREATNEN